MHRDLKIICVACLALAVAVGAAAREGDGPTVGQATRHDVSLPLAELAKPAKGFSGFNVEVNPLHSPGRTPGPGAAAGFVDPVLQADGEPAAGAALTPAPSLVFEGLSDDLNAVIAGVRIVPPDTEGDVGVDYYVQWINLIFAVYDKNTGAIAPGGGPFAGDSIWNGFGGPCETNNDGDPIVIYDHLAGRWFLSQFSIDQGVQCVAISQTGDPTGSYDRWEFLVSPGQNNDYPKFGLMPESYVLTLRDFPSGTFPFASAVLFDRAAMLAGDPSPRFVKEGLFCGSDCVDGWQPPHLEGPAPAAGTPVIISKVWDDDFDGPVTGCDGVRLWQFDVDWAPATPTTSFSELATACGANFDNNMCGFFNRNCIPQAGVSQLLDPIDELQMYRAQYRSFPSHDTLMVNTTVDAGGDRAGQRWIELRNAGSGWSIHQEGTYAPADGQERWMGSVAMDGDGNIALGFSVSSASTFPSIAYNTRAATSAAAPGVLDGGEVMMHAGSGSQTGANRWGDYSSMSVDPVDDCTFWYTQEYYQNTGSFDFNTKVGSFKFADCGGPECTVDADCDDVVACTDDACVAGSCEYTPNDANCPDDGQFCNGDEYCDATADCSSTGDPCLPGETCNEVDDICEVDNCGNGVCDPEEDCLTCSADCPSGPPVAPGCGNGVCEPGIGEDCLSCAADCRGKQNGKPSNRYCCGDGDGEGAISCSANDGTICNQSGWTCSDIPQGGYCCGDDVCDGGDECTVCDADCSGDPVCDTGGGCTLGQPGDACTSNGDCCSNKCKGKPGSQTCR